MLSVSDKSNTFCVLLEYAVCDVLELLDEVPLCLLGNADSVAVV
jgi:hypothetical protein